MTPAPKRFLQNLAVLFLFASTLALPAQAAPSAYTETNANLAFGYQFLPAPSIAFQAGGEYAFAGPLDIDFSVSAQVRYVGTLEGEIVGKALLFPALGGNPPIGLAVLTNLKFLTTPGFGLRFGLGSAISLDLSPVVVSLSALATLGSDGTGGFSFGLDAGLGVTYYLDPLALDLSLDYTTHNGALRAWIGLRYLL